MMGMAMKVKRKVDRLWKAQKGDWGSCAARVQVGDEFSCDCKTYAMTCAELLVQQGADPEKVRIAECVTPDGPHMVCVADVWVIDNLSDVIWAWDCLEYEWIRSMKMSEPGTWRTA